MSDYTVTVRLEPFLQRFLKAQFEQSSGQNFKFPARHNFNTMLEFMVTKQPKDFLPPDYGEDTFRIELPTMEYKNVAVHNYLSEKRQIILCKKIKEFMYMKFNFQLSEAIRRYNMTREQAIDFLMEEFGFIPDDYDRLLKEYQRWLKMEQHRRYSQKKKLQKSQKKNEKKDVSLTN